MHDTALEIGRLFFGTYARPPCTVVELGSLDVNGALRTVAPESVTYIGLDASAGPGVDLVIKAGLPLPLQTDCADLVVSSSTFEHDDFFWDTFLEMVRITKPGGAIYINAPSNGPYHRYPSDNWRFYPDCGRALQRWARSRSQALTLLESFVAERRSDVWNDFTAIFVKSSEIEAGSVTFLSDSIPSTNVWRVGEPDVMHAREAPEDMVLLQRSAGPSQETGDDTAGGAPASGIASPVRAWQDRERQFEKSLPLAPHVSIAFPELAAMLEDSSGAAPELRSEIRSLLESHARRLAFDENFYLRAYGDVAVAMQKGQITSAFLHFCSSGYAEGRLPVDPEVDPIWYLETYPDVLHAIEAGQVDSVDDHFRKSGYREGRAPSARSRPDRP
jgi:SAM-dependent methyltransferase